MIRVPAVACALCLVMAPDSVAAVYGWSLSGSATDPGVNTAPATSPGEPFQVYLWLSCSPFDGIAAVGFSLDTNFTNDGFATMGGALNAGDSIDLGLAVGGCPEAHFLIGAWTFQDPTGLGGTACLVAGAWGNITVDCDTLGSPSGFPHAITGFTTTGTAPCQIGTCTDPVSIDVTSWGSTKGLYR